MDVLKLELKIFLFIIAGFTAAGQEKQIQFYDAGTQQFGQYIYLYGFQSIEQTNRFKIYRTDPELNILDSITLPVRIKNEDSFLPAWSDTLHDFLNIYLQKKNEKVVTVFRFSKQFTHLATIENIEVARLNNSSMFSSQAYYYNKNVYDLRAETDTGGAQYYVNKYELKSGETNFDYQRTWQFALERKNISAANIVYADRNSVFLFVNLRQKRENTQWLLNINVNTGHLIRGTKLTPRGEKNIYCYGTVHCDSTTKSVQLFGTKYSELQVGVNSGKLGLAGINPLMVFYIAIDSMGNVMSRQEFKIPVSTAPSVNKDKPGFILKMISVQIRNSSVKLLTDVYKNNNNALCFAYANSATFEFKQDADGLTLTKGSISNYRQLEDFYSSTDNEDDNGKLCVDSVADFGQLFFKQPVLPVKAGYKTDDGGNPVWLLKRADLRKRSINFSTLAPVQKVYKLLTLADIPKTSRPELMIFDKTRYYISKQANDGMFEIRALNW